MVRASSTYALHVLKKRNNESTSSFSPPPSSSCSSLKTGIYIALPTPSSRCSLMALPKARLLSIVLR